MKKLVAVFLIAIMVMTAGCGDSKSEVSETKESSQAESTFERVELIDGAKAGAIPAETDETHTSHYEPESNNTEIAIQYTEADQKAAVAVRELQDILLNPQSLQLHSIYADEMTTQDGVWIIKMDVSAQTRAGGMNRKDYYIQVENDNSISDFAFDDDMMMIHAVAWSDRSAQELDVDKILSMVD